MYMYVHVYLYVWCIPLYWMFKLQVYEQRSLLACPYAIESFFFLCVHMQLAGKLVTDRRKFQMGVIEVCMLPFCFVCKCKCACMQLL